MAKSTSARRKKSEAGQPGGSRPLSPTARLTQGIPNARQAIAMIAETGDELIEEVRAIHAPPVGSKGLRKFRISEAASMVGKSAQWIRDREGNEPREEDAAQRTYSLEDINRLREAAGTLPQRAPGDPPQVISVLNFKGGVAKTTTTHLLSHYLANAGYRVLLIDLDPQGSLTACFEITDENGHVRKSFEYEESAGYVLARNSAGTLADKIRATHWPTIDIVPAAIDSYQSEFDIAVAAFDERRRGVVQLRDPFWNRLDRALQEVTGYDVVLIDSAPAMSFSLINAFLASDGILIPSPARNLDVEAMVKFSKVVEEWIIRLEPLDPERAARQWLRIMFTQYKNSSVSQQVLTQLVRQKYGSITANATIPESEALRKGSAGAPSPYEGVPEASATLLHFGGPNGEGQAGRPLH